MFHFGVITVKIDTIIKSQQTYVAL